jgi:hypothetical protein
MEQKDFSFQRGWSHVRQTETARVRGKIMAVLNVTTRAGFINRLNGKTEPKVTEYEAIERIFGELGITDIWGAMNKYSFQKGWGQLERGDAKEARAKIVKALGLSPKCKSIWGLRLKGRIEPRVSEAEAIENIFAEYGITEVWGEE